MEAEEDQHDNLATVIESENKHGVLERAVLKETRATENDQPDNVERSVSEETSVTYEKEHEKENEIRSPVSSKKETNATKEHDVARSEDTSLPRCELCLEDLVETTAVAFCVNCVEFMCTRCAQDHRRIKLTRHHKLLNDKDMPRRSDVFKTIKELTTCQDHPEMNVSYICEDHNIYICSTCAAVNHRKCERITEVMGQAATADINNPGPIMEERLRSLCEKAAAIRESKEANMSALLVDHENINIKRNDFKERVVSHVHDLWESSHVETEALLDEEMGEIKDDIQTCQTLESEGAKNQELLKTTLLYGSPIEISIISSKILEVLQKLEEETNLQQAKPKVLLECTNNVRFLDQKQLCKITAIKGDSAIEESVVQMTVQHSSDTCSGEENDTTLDPVTRGIGEEVAKHNVSTPCTIRAMTLMNDGRIAIIDMNNNRLTVINDDFSYNTSRKLEGAPIDMCEASDNLLVVIFQNGRRVREYRAEENAPCFDDGGFLTSSSPLSIASLNAKHSTIALLYARELEIRDFRNGQIRQVFSHSISSPYRMRVNIDTFMHTCILIDDESKLHNFHYTPKLIKNKCVYGGSGYGQFGEISDITTDKVGNVYILYKGSNNMHRISVADFTERRVLTLNLENPVSLCVDKTGTKVVVGCENDDHLHVYPLV